ncbi:uncharacterized protein [Rutidosis leptorrhynchoides]|uniref:uncharacterized protein isoform X1 n=1 Tax=Rutidosis leptorrhynchoides TaxID=125765 RepID=UPI003A99CA9E
MVSDSDLISRLHEYLDTADLTTTTTATVRRQLEQDFEIDLTDKKAFIREQVDLYLENKQQEEVQKQELEEEIEAELEEEIEAELEEAETDDEIEDSNSKSGGSRKKGSKKEDKEVKKKGGGFTKLCSLSPQLQQLTGVAELARTEVVKQLWSYIREHNLQDPANKRNIRCDGPFRELFGVDTIDMFQMNKALTKHIWPLNSDGASPASAVPKEKKPKKEREEDSDEPKRKEKRQKSAGGSSGILALIPLSDALVKFLGTGENALARSDVVKRIWDYIKQNNLQDPSDKRRILCDEKLKELFDVETFVGFSVAKLLATHFIKAER